MQRVIAALALVILLSGCSLVLLDKPPPGDGPLPDGSCTTSKAAPLLDVAGVPLGLLAALASQIQLFEEVDPAERVAGAVGGVAMAGVSGYSAVSGFKSTSACRRRQSMSEQAIADHLRILAREIREREAHEPLRRYRLSGNP